MRPVFTESPFRFPKHYFTNAKRRFTHKFSKEFKTIVWVAIRFSRKFESKVKVYERKVMVCEHKVYVYGNIAKDELLPSMKIGLGV